MLWSIWPAAHGGDVQFITDTLFVESRDGYIALQWTPGSQSTFELQQSQDPEFTFSKVLYTGPDRASFISGLRNGDYYFRVKGQPGEWSDTLYLKVTHQSLQLALFLAAMGLIVFLLTVWVVVKGQANSSIETN